MMFLNRLEAGQALGERLQKWRDRGDVVVLGIPRGGVIVAAQVAHALGAPLDVFLTHKLGAPDNPELAIGAVAGDGTTILDQDIIGDLDVPPAYVEQERQAQLREIERRLAVYRQGRPAVQIEGRCAILCDDGIATGSTALAALRALRAQQPSQVILAIPVSPPGTADRLARECDEVIALATPEPFIAVGRFYQRFEQVTDEQVIAALGAAPHQFNSASATHSLDTHNL